MPRDAFHGVYYAVKRVSVLAPPRRPHAAPRTPPAAPRTLAPAHRTAPPAPGCAAHPGRVRLMG